MEQVITNLLLNTIEYGGYISIIKLIIFLLLFFLWLPLVSWVYTDAKSLETKEVFWSAIILGTGMAALLIWLLMPLFIIGMLLYLIAVGAVSLSYVMHRNTKVPEFNRVLTANHIKGIFSREEQKLKSTEDFVFITANRNEVPLPKAKTPDFFGYKKAYDILIDAEWRRASDIIFSPSHQSYQVKYFVDGAAIKMPDVPHDQIEYLLRFLKHLADLDVEEKRKPQKGKFAIFHNKKRSEWELTTAGSTVGEQFKLKPKTELLITRLTEIGLTETQYKQFSSLRETKQGLFIVSGPKNSGVTTTFYALLRNHDAFINSICILEHKSSANLPNITQNVFKLGDSGITTYAKKLQQVIRTEPNIVGVADCSDAETAKIACAAAKDGKIVYLTLEADNVLKALARFVKFVEDKDLIADVLLGISNQRLLRNLCGTCKQGYEPDKELLRKFNIPAEKAKVLYRAGKVVYDKRGKSSTCNDCQGTGFIGRTAVFETIMINDELRNVIRQSKSLQEVGTEFRRAKMFYLQEQALIKVVNGLTSINEMVGALSTSKSTGVKKPG